jgi:putative ABC transport system permease protein
VDKLFGVQMTTIMEVLIVLLAICLLAVAWVALRKPVVFKMGMRNIPRRKAQTILVVVGLMLSTLIISAALGTGDTMNNSIGSLVYDQLGQVDEIVLSSDTPKANMGAPTTKIPESSVDVVTKALNGDPNVAAVMGALDATVPAINQQKNLAKPIVHLLGADPAQAKALGGIDVKSGSLDFSGMPAGEHWLVASQKLADDLQLKVGDAVTVIYQGVDVPFIVHGIANTTFLTGQVSDNPDGTSGFGALVDLKDLQTITNQPNTLTAVLISNTGGVRDGGKVSDAVTSKLDTALQGTGLGYMPAKKDGVHAAEVFGSIFTGLFIVLGLFSIAAGILLIVLIFTMLAAERRSEMGMARAVGQRRGQLIQQFVSEGSGYAILAGLIGAALGVAATYLIAGVMGMLIGKYFTVHPTVSARSLIVAYALGVVITFIAVVGSSWKVSRLNIVAAVRDIPDASSPKRKKRTLVYGGLMLIAGGLLTMVGLSSKNAFSFYFGMSLMPFGVAMFLRFFGVPSRPVFTIVGFYLVIFWLLPSNVADRLFGKLDGGIEMFFLSGIFMVVGATIVIVQNTDWLLAGVTALGGLFKSKLPAVKTAVAYPGAARGRTGMAIAMFSLIVFSLVMMATMSSNYSRLYLSDDAKAGWDVQVITQPSNPLPDLKGTLQAQGYDVSTIKTLGEFDQVDDGVSHVKNAGAAKYAFYNVNGMSAAAIDGTAWKFKAHADGYATDADIVNALKSGQNVAVVDSNALGSGGNGNPFGGDNVYSTGLKTDVKTFAPFQIEVANANGSKTVTLTVIGIISEKLSALQGVYAPEASVATVAASNAPRTYMLQMNSGVDSKVAADTIQATLIRQGVNALSIQEQLKENQSQNSGFLYIIQGFMGLGLVVGIAAVGVISFRSVVERRQQIGVLRAIGYTKDLVSLSFLIETGFIVGLGSLAGTILGLVLARNLISSDSSTSGNGFYVPIPLILIILVATVIAALAMTWIPSRQAASLAPAEALRYE